MSTMNTMKAWLKAATPAEQDLLAQRAGTSRAYLFHLGAGEGTNYKREPKVSLAAAIERETKAMARVSKGRLPVVYRTDLNSGCRACDFARRCLGEDVVTASEFPIVSAQTLTEGGQAD